MGGRPADASFGENILRCAPLSLRHSVVKSALLTLWLDLEKRIFFFGQIL